MFSVLQDAPRRSLMANVPLDHGLDGQGALVSKMARFEKKDFQRFSQASSRFSTAVDVDQIWKAMGFEDVEEPVLEEKKRVGEAKVKYIEGNFQEGRSILSAVVVTQLKTHRPEDAMKTILEASDFLSSYRDLSIEGEGENQSAGEKEKKQNEELVAQISTYQLKRQNFFAGRSGLLLKNILKEKVPSEEQLDESEWWINKASFLNPSPSVNLALQLTRATVLLQRKGQYKASKPFVRDLMLSTPVDHSFDLQMNVYELFVCNFTLNDHDSATLLEFCDKYKGFSENMTMGQEYYNFSASLIETVRANGLNPLFVKNVSSIFLDRIRAYGDKRLLANALLEVGNLKAASIIESIKEQIFNVSDLYYLTPSQQDNGISELSEALSLFHLLNEKNRVVTILSRLVHMLRLNGESERGLALLEEAKNQGGQEVEEEIWYSMHKGHMHYYRVYETSPLLSSGSAPDDPAERARLIASDKEGERISQEHMRLSLKFFQSSLAYFLGQPRLEDQDAKIVFHLHGFLSHLYSSAFLDDPSLFVSHLTKRGELAVRAGFVDDAWRVLNYLAIWNAQKGNHEASLALLGDTLEKIKETIEEHRQQSTILFQPNEEGKVLGPFPVICHSLLTSCTVLGYDAVQQQMFVSRVLNVISRYSSFFPGSYDSCNQVIGHHLRELQRKTEG